MYLLLSGIAINKFLKRYPWVSIKCVHIDEMCAYYINESILFLFFKTYQKYVQCRYKAERNAIVIAS